MLHGALTVPFCVPHFISTLTEDALHCWWSTLAVAVWTYNSEMGGCRCSYKNCKSATKTTENLHFFHYPVKHPDRCAIWIQNAEKSEFFKLPKDQLRNKVICGLHFQKKYFTNSAERRLVHNAIPTLDEGCELELSSAKDVYVLPVSPDGTTFTLKAEDLEPGPSTKPNPSIKVVDGTFVYEDQNVESEVYTIDPLYINQLTEKSPENDEFVYHHINNEFNAEYSLTAESNFLESAGQENENVAQLFQDFLPATQENVVTPKTTSVRNATFKNVFPTKRSVMKRIFLNEQGIRNIKLSLARRHVGSPTNIEKLLRGRVPNSLLGAVLLHLNKKQTLDSLSNEEMTFMRVMNSISPSAFIALRNEGWYIPHEVTNFNETLNSST